VGSVSEYIVRHAPCDVLVVRTEELQEYLQPQVATTQLR
ncbi:universal stress protein, partial [Staphylococcus aureus]|nr:universal stress protein [Staphylococcus aureus]